MNFKKRLSPSLALAASVVLLSACSGGNKMGEEVYMGTCIACHSAGLNGAPILGNKKMWGPRLTKGTPTLIESATNGFGLMPAKGGKTELTDEQISAAVNYMVSQVE